MFKSLRARLSATVILLLALSLGVMGVWLVTEFRDFYVERMEEGAVSQAKLAEALAREDYTPKNLESLADTMGFDRNVYITFLSPEGQVWGESKTNDTQPDQQIDSPEIRAAQQGEVGVDRRANEALGVPMLYVAVPSWDTLGNLQGIVRVAIDITAAEVAFARFRIFTLTGGLVSLIVGSLLALIHAQAVSEPLQKMSAVALDIASGRFHRRADVAGTTETQQLAQALNVMAHNLERELHRAQMTTEKLQDVLGSMRDGVLLIDNKENIELINPAAAEMLSFNTAVTLGKRDTILLRHPDLSELLRQARSEGSACHKRIILSSHSARHIRASVLPLDLGRILIVLQDLTEVYTAVDIRRDFVANVSHELRTPLTSLGLMVENLLRGALDEREVAEDFLRRMAGEIERLTEMVLELLQLSRLESGTEELRKTEINTWGLVQEVVHDMSGLFVSKNQRVIVDGGRGAVFSADREKIKQVLINLLDNAVKFSESGSTITIGFEEHSQEIDVHVRDHGPGILPEHLPRVFERFFKHSVSRGGGTGLGLAIVKHIIEAHGGSVYVRSRLGEGATFGFTMPKRDSEREI